MSLFGVPTKKIFQFVDHHLRPHVGTFPSYLKGTTDILLKLQSLPNNLPDDTILVTLRIDVTYCIQTFHTVKALKCAEKP